jgi:hypothetical protein
MIMKIGTLWDRRRLKGNKNHEKEGIKPKDLSA